MNTVAISAFADELLCIKEAAVLTTGAREKIKGKHFAVKKKDEEGSYPIATKILGGKSKKSNLDEDGY